MSVLQSNKVPVVQPSHAVHPLTPLITYSDEHFAPGPHSGHHPQDSKGIRTHTYKHAHLTNNDSDFKLILETAVSRVPPRPPSAHSLEQLEEPSLWGWQGVWLTTAHELNSICAPSGRRSSLQQLNTREKNDRRKEGER